MANQGNLPALMEQLYKRTLRNESDRQAIGRALIEIAKANGMTNDEIMEALWETHEGPVFYYP
jgi:hypothetical protein